MSLSILAGFGMQKIKQKFYLFIPLLFIIAIAIDYLPSRPTGICLSDQNNRVYELVAKNSDGKKILEIPIWPGDSAWSSIYQYYVTTSNVEMINGYSPAVPRDYIDNVFYPLYNVNLGEIRPQQYELLKELNIKYVILHQEAFPVKVSPYPSGFSILKLKHSPYLSFIKNDGPIWLFELLPDKSKKPPQLFEKQTSIIGKVYEAEKLRHKTGQIINDPIASFTAAISGDIIKDEAGYLTYGPWRKYPTGNYKAVFRLKVADNQNNDLAATIDVAAKKGDIILSEKKLKGQQFQKENTYQNFTLPFKLKEPTRIEFRTYFHKNTSICIDYIYLIFADQKDPLLTVETEDSFHIAQLKHDPEASGQLAIMAVPHQDPSDFLTSGPYRQYLPGNYRALFRLKIDSNSENQVAELQITSDGRKTILAKKSLTTRDFERNNIYQEIHLSFTLDKTSILEFLVKYQGKVKVWYDKVAIIKLDKKTLTTKAQRHKGRTF